jgi:predicted TIM-barrel fold metal-dependent hydrolase
MEIFDSHLHLTPSTDLSWSFSRLIENIRLAEVSGGLIICNQSDSWDFAQVGELVGLNKNFKLAISPDLSVSTRALGKAIEKWKRVGAVALKIHPRIQKTNLQSKQVHFLVRRARDLNLPIVICSFNDGSWSRIGMSNIQFIRLADDFPDVKFLWAHAGGHNVLDFMFMARRVPNVFLDTSFTQSYFFKGAILENLNYATESLKNRFMFGTDFELESYPESVRKLSDFYLSHNLDRNAFFSDNYKFFLGINE